MENPVNKSNTLIDAEPTVRMSVRFVTPGGHGTVHRRPDLRRRVGWEGALDAEWSLEHSCALPRVTIH